MKRKIKKIFDVVQPYTMIYISFESSQRDLQVEHGQFENLKFVQFRKIKLFFTIPLGVPKGKCYENKGFGKMKKLEFLKT